MIFLSSKVVNFFSYTIILKSCYVLNSKTCYLPQLKRIKREHFWCDIPTWAHSSACCDPAPVAPTLVLAKETNLAPMVSKGNNYEKNVQS